MGAIGLGAFRLGLDFFTDAQQDWSRLDRSDLETLVFGVAALALWGVLVAVKAATANFVGVIVLRVPASPIVPSPIRYGALSGVVSRVEAAAEDCSCLKNPHNPGDEDDAFMGKFIRVDDLCAVHGIEAVNALPPAEFARVAAQPWIWGGHVNDGLVPVRATVLLLGLYGWGSRPVPVWDEETRTAGRARRVNNIYAHGVSEVLDRSRRRLRWRGAADTGLEPVSFVGETGDVLDMIPLSSVGLNGHAVRVAGERPYLKPV